MEVEVNVAPVPSVASTENSNNICVRAGCTNPAVESKDWDKEYCSNECVATHCRLVYGHVAIAVRDAHTFKYLH